MAAKPREEWLSLSDVAEMLGVHPSTVRLWSDKGVLPVHRTSGRHRRYRRAEVELWMKTSREKHIIEPASALQSAVGQVRMQIAEGRLEAEPWNQKLDENARTQYRLSGMTLVRGLMTYLASEELNAASEAYAIGYDDASRARRYGLSRVDPTPAFFVFRSRPLGPLVHTHHAGRGPSG